MISVAEALLTLHENLPEPRSERVGLEDAFGRSLVEDILSAENLPRYSSAAMDGVAVKWQDVKCLGPGHHVVLTVVRESQAGSREGRF